jgi:group I intron endonuclease
MSGQTYTIYLIEDHRMKPYVGVTSKTLEERLEKHWETARAGRNTYIYRAMRKYGIENFEITPLEATNDEFTAFQKEKEWIKKLDTFHGWGYNMNEGGRGGSAKHEKAPNACLTETEAREIKWLALNTELKHKDIISNYPAVDSATTVSQIKRNVQWQGIEPKRPKQIPHGEKSPRYVQRQQAAQIKWLDEKTDLSKADIAEKLDTRRERVRKITNGYKFKDVEPNKPFSSKGFKYLSYA